MWLSSHHVQAVLRPVSLALQWNASSRRSAAVGAGRERQVQALILLSAAIALFVLAVATTSRTPAAQTSGGLMRPAGLAKRPSPSLRPRDHRARALPGRG